MKNKLLLACLCVCVAFGSTTMVPTVFAKSTTTTTTTSQSIKDKQEQISKAEEEKKQLQNSLTDLKKLKEKLETEKKDLKNYVSQLDNNLAQIEQNIAELKSQIATKEQEIIETEAMLEQALATEEKQRADMIVRIRAMYEKGDSFMLEGLMESKGFADFLNKADYAEKIVAYDMKMWETYKESRELVELCKKELELERQILSQAKVNVEAEQASLEDLIAQKNKDISAYESDISNKDKAIKEYEEYIAEQNEIIAALEKAIAEEKRQTLAANGNVITYDGGVFKFPLASYTRMSDDYGWRIHPTLGVEKFHNGVDFAAPKGTAIYAAYDGKVVAATYSSSMGNYVMIDHGDGLYTIYMHASALYVSKGDVVVRGETIAAVGTTGRSTGNHLHFGVRLNGEYVSPWNYISE